ncbi:MAG: DNA repair protein [Chloroflexi bacterium]|nr:MAG: DNA repair protein [Chloroflexota bacterium]
MGDAGGTDRLHFTGDEQADRLLAAEPMALLIGFALDQQVTVQKAFSGPLELKRRIGTLDATRIAELPLPELVAAFQARPALHRFPGAMARRVQDLAAYVRNEYGGEAARLWTEAPDASALRQRIAQLPGFGEMKVSGLTAVLVKRLGVQPPGWQDALPDHPTLGDVDSAEALELYQARKRAHKAELRAAGGLQ